MAFATRWYMVALALGGVGALQLELVSNWSVHMSDDRRHIADPGMIQVALAVAAASYVITPRDPDLAGALGVVFVFSSCAALLLYLAYMVEVGQAKIAYFDRGAFTWFLGHLLLVGALVLLFICGALAKFLDLPYMSQ